MPGQGSSPEACKSPLFQPQFLRTLAGLHEVQELDIDWGHSEQVLWSPGVVKRLFVWDLVEQNLPLPQRFADDSALPMAHIPTGSPASGCAPERDHNLEFRELGSGCYRKLKKHNTVAACFFSRSDSKPKKNLHVHAVIHCRSCLPHLTGPPTEQNPNTR